MKLQTGRHGTFLSYLAAAAVLAAVWVPEFAHYYVPGADIENVIEELRDVPDTDVLNEAGEMGLLLAGVDKAKTPQLAEDILRGKLDIKGYLPKEITLPFDEKDLVAGSPSWQLLLAGFAAPNILLDAYERTGKEEYFDAARDMIIAWADYEQNAWLPQGFLWNDHAIAARIPVLAKFWRLYRDHASFNVSSADKVLQMVVRSGQLLTKSGHFTFSTNHGVIQNLALWNICLAFPGLPGVAEFKQIALSRLHDQMGFYINDEGVVLEHSAEYHSHGVQLLGMALRYMTLLDIPIPPGWIDKYKKSKEFYAAIRRPDGSLPMYGDTKRNGDPLGVMLTTVGPGNRASRLERDSSLRPASAQSLYPAAGYSVWWDGLENWGNGQPLAQTVVTWSYFPGHGHKLADEMSVILWADGQPWWTNVGYWPYGYQGRKEALSWLGSNAPHVLGESADSVRETSLRYQGKSNGLSLIDLQRNGPVGYQAQRQVVHIAPDLWLVIDHAQDSKHRDSMHTWTAYPGLQISADSNTNGFFLQGSASATRLFTYFKTANGTGVEHLRGSTDPFAGWIVTEDRKISKADAFVVRRPSDGSWSLAVWKLVRDGGDETFSSDPRMLEWRDGDNWHVSLPMSAGTIEIRRQGERLIVSDEKGSGRDQSLVLTKGPDVSPDVARTHSNFAAANAKYEKRRDLREYRLRVTYVLLALFVLQELFFFVTRRFLGKARGGLRIISALGWAGIGGWLTFVYFVS